MTDAESCLRVVELMPPVKRVLNTNQTLGPTKRTRQKDIGVQLLGLTKSSLQLKEHYATEKQETSIETSFDAKLRCAWNSATGLQSLTYPLTKQPRPFYPVCCFRGCTSFFKKIHRPWSVSNLYSINGGMSAEKYIPTTLCDCRTFYRTHHVVQEAL